MIWSRHSAVDVVVVRGVMRGSTENLSGSDRELMRQAHREGRRFIGESD